MIKKKKPMDCMKAMEIFKVLFFGGFVCAIAALVLGLIYEPLMNILGWIAIISFVSGLAFGYTSIRCPDCGEMLLIGRMPGVPRVCPGCGKKLRED